MVLTSAITNERLRMKQSKAMKATLVKATDLQARYRKMGAPHTQNVRNPFPLHMLVLSVLPALPAPDDTVHAKAKVSAFGKSFLRTISMSAEELLGKYYWDNYAMTTKQVCNTLRSQGFIVNDQTVRQILSKLNTNHWSPGKVDSTSSRQRPGLGRPKTLYFVRS